MKERKYFWNQTDIEVKYFQQAIIRKRKTKHCDAQCFFMLGANE